jgi:hypothetical protein
LADAASTCPFQKDTLILNSENLYGHILGAGTTVDSEESISPWVDTHYSEAFSVVLDLLVKTHECFNFPKPGVQDFIRLEDKVRLSNLQKWIDIRVMMQQMKLVSGQPQWKYVVHLPLGVSQIVFCSYYAIISLTDDPDKGSFLFDYDQIMMVCDTLSA